MSGDILTVGAVVAFGSVGVTVGLFVWRRIETRLDRLETRLDGRLDDMRQEMNGQLGALAADVVKIDKRLAAVETTLDLLIKGLHIEVSGRQ